MPLKATGVLEHQVKEKLRVYNDIDIPICLLEIQWGDMPKKA